MKILKKLALVLVLLLLFVATGSTVKASWTSDFHGGAAAISSGQPRAVLIAGTQVIDGQQVISTVTVAAVNPMTHKTTYVNIDPMKLFADNDYMALEYQVGGVDRVRIKLESMLGLRFNDIYEVNMNQLGDFASALGGIKVTNTKAFNMNGIGFGKGTSTFYSNRFLTAFTSEITLNDAENAAARRNTVGLAILSKVRNLPNLNAIWGPLQNDVRTNLTASQLVSVFAVYRTSLNPVTVTMAGTAQNGINPGRYSQAAVNRVRTLIHNAL